MRHNEVIYLLSTTYDFDEWDNQIETVSERQVFANEYSISSSEFYEAKVSGLKPSKRFEIYSFEYQGEEKFKYDGDIYEVVSTDKRGEKIRITGEKTLSSQEVGNESEGG